jgi:hypothetical protein
MKGRRATRTLPTPSPTSPPVARQRAYSLYAAKKGDTKPQKRTRCYTTEVKHASVTLLSESVTPVSQSSQALVVSSATRLRPSHSAIRNLQSQPVAVVYPIPHLYQQENPAHHSRTPTAAKGRMERRTRHVGTGFSPVASDHGYYPGHCIPKIPASNP